MENEGLLVSVPHVPGFAQWVSVGTVHRGDMLLMVRSPSLDSSQRPCAGKYRELEDSFWCFMESCSPGSQASLGSFSPLLK